MPTLSTFRQLIGPPSLIAMLWLGGQPISAQQIDLSLHATAVPDSFEVRATSSGPDFTYLPNAVFTVRWEASAGGLMNYADVRRSCGAYQLNVGLGLQTIGNYNYFTFVLLGDRSLATAGCPITTAGQDLVGFRIRQLSGCRNVQLVQNVYSQLNNLNYFISIGGQDATGELDTTPIAGGDCGPCTPPEIISVDHGMLGPCGYGPLTFSMTTAGADIDHGWWSVPAFMPLAWLPEVSFPLVSPGTYMAVATNACGADSMFFTVAPDTALCIPPELTHVQGVQQGFVSPTYQLVMTGIGTCPTYNWYGPSGTALAMSTAGTSASFALPNGTYMAVMSNTCGADTMTFTWDQGPPCIIPSSGVVNMLPFSPCSSDSAMLHATFLDAAGVPLIWTGPAGDVVGTGPTVSLDWSAIGQYTVTATNICGSSSVDYDFNIDTAYYNNCVPPRIDSLYVMDMPICLPAEIRIVPAIAMGGPCPYPQWSGPNIQDHGLNGIRAWATDGEHYQLIWSNSCGSDTADLIVRSDTTGLAACIPPMIHDLSAPTICAGDTLELSAVVQASGPCLRFEWTGPNTWPFPSITVVNDTLAIVPEAQPGQYRLSVSNACGSASAVHVADMAPIVQAHIRTCTWDPYDMNQLHASSMVPGGYWMENGAWTDGIYWPATDTSTYYYYYHPGADCPSIRLRVNELGVILNAGEDVDLVVCSNSAPVDLFDYMSPDATPGWSFLDVNTPLNTGLYVPALNGPFVQARYMVTTFGCQDVAYWTITKEPAVPWYADADGDGLGDAADSVLSCDPTDGRVQIAGDACPQLFGTVGDPCDDGNPGTTGEVIDAECTCKVHVGISDQNVAGGWSLWPNPARGQEVLVQGPVQPGPVTINVLDASGRTVLQRTLVNSGTPLPLPLHHLASGSYTVRIIVPDRVVTLRSVVE